MTKEQATFFLEQNLPLFKKQFCITSYDEDALQMACIQFIKSAHKIYDDIEPRGYLYGIFVHTRKRQKEHYSGRITYCESVTDHDQTRHPGHYPLTQMSVQADQTIRERAKEYLDELTDPRSKRICELYYIEGYCSREIGAIVGVSGIRVRQILYESIAIIQAILRERGEL